MPIDLSPLSSYFLTTFLGFFFLVILGVVVVDSDELPPKNQVQLVLL